MIIKSKALSSLKIKKSGLTWLYLLFVLTLGSFQLQAQNMNEQILEYNGKLQWDRFGSSTAISGNKAAVGLVGTSARGGGRISFYKFNGSNWELEDILLASDNAPNNLFGISIDMQGNTCVVGDRLGHDGQVPSLGAIYIFEYDEDNGWEEVAKHFSPTPSYKEDFGYTVKIDGDQMLIGAHNSEAIGSAYIFERSNGTWNFKDQLTPSTAQPEESVGWDVDLSGDHAIMGSYYSPTVYFFEQINGDWVETASFTKSNDFSLSVAIENDLALVSRPSTNSVFLYSKSSGEWLQQSIINCPDNCTNSDFGGSIKMEGQYALIGASLGTNEINGTISGAVYLYEIVGDKLVFLRKISPQNGSDYDRFATRSNAIDTDGYSIIVSSPDADSSTIQSTGLVHLFSETCSINAEIENMNGTLIAPNYPDASYQWFDCSSNTPIPNQTNSTFTPNTSGSFSVGIGRGACNEISGCFDLLITSLEHSSALENEIKISPNPASEYLHFSFPSVEDEIQILMFNSLGQKVDQYIINDQELSINLANYSKGMYHVQFNLKNKETITYKVLIN